MTTLQVLLNVAAQRDYELHSLDFSTAFLQCSWHEKIWLRRPPGFTGSFPARTQWSLRRPVYSLRQAPREWHDTQRTTLAALRFTPSAADASLFLRTDTSLPPFYVLMYFDDLVFATSDTKALTLVKPEPQKRHTSTDLGELRSYLGFQITRDRAWRTITLTQLHMVHEVLQCFSFQFSSPQPTPLSTSHSLSAPPSDEFVEPSGLYPELVGCLVYLMTCTRPDLPVLRLHSDRGVMEVARTSMIHGAAPHFLWPFAVRYAAHQLNLWPCVSLLETSPTLRWTRKVGDASVLRVWGSRAFVRDTFADKLSARAIPCEVTFDESVPFYRLFPYRFAPPPPMPLFLAPGPPPVDPLPPQGPAPSGVSQVDPLPSIVPVQVAVGSGAAPGAASGGVASRRAEPGGAGSEGAGFGGVEPGGAEPEGVEPRGAQSEGAESGGAAPWGAALSGGLAGASPRARDTRAGGAAVTAGAGDTGGTAATGPGGACTSGGGATGTGGVGCAKPGGAGVGGPGAGGTGGAGAGLTLELEVLGVPSSIGLPPPFLCPLPDQSHSPLQPASPLPAPSPYSEQSDGLTERRKPASRPVSPVCTTRYAPRLCPPPVPGTHAMALRPSSVPLRVPLPAPPESSLLEVPNPAPDSARAARPTLSRLLATAVTDPSFESPTDTSPVGPPHASAAVFPVARLGCVAIFVLSRARVARDIFSARRAPRGTRRCPARRAPRGMRRCPKLPVACPLVRDGALSRRGSAPGARDGVQSRRGPAPGARGGAPASPAPALAAAAPAPPSACPWSSRPRYCTRCSRLCLTPRLHSLQPPLTYPRRPSVTALRLSPCPPPPPSSLCSRGGEGMGVAGVGVMGGVLPFPSSSFRSHCCSYCWGGGCEGVGEPGEWHWGGGCETNQQPSLHLSSLPPSAAPAAVWGGGGGGG
ncbi:unnamed protein product [Closterium sp. NIES-54]